MNAPQLDPLAGEVLQLLRKHEILPTLSAGQTCRLVVGVSGGLDSVCLAHLLYALADELHLEVHLAHVDHGLRPHSSEDAAFVERLAAQGQAPFHMTRLNPTALRASSLGVEAAARQERYAFLRSVAVRIAPSGQTPLVAVAHHADDQAETFLLRLIHGGGVRGLAAMRLATEWPATEAGELPVRIVRPLLHVRRARLHEYAARHNLIWREDETNQDIAFSRNRLRRQVTPQLEAINPRAVENICRSAEMLAAAADQLAQGDAGLLVALTLEETPNIRIVLDLERLRRLAFHQRCSVLYSAIQRIFRDVRQIGLAHLEAIAYGATERSLSDAPHPVADGVSWSVGVGPSSAATGIQRPPWLSLHRRDVLPVPLTHPWLDTDMQARLAQLLPDEGRLSFGQWELSIQRHNLEDGRFLPMGRHPWQAWLDADRCGPLLAAVPAAGMRFAPMGLQGRGKALGDFLTDRKLPASLRPGWPLVLDAADKTILWVCGLAVAERAALRIGSQRALHLVWRLRQESSVNGG